MTIESKSRYASAAPGRGSSRAVLAFVARARPFGFWTRVALVAGTCVVAFWPVLRSQVQAIIDGSPTAYLLLMPVWASAIAHTARKRPRKPEINDAEVDRIVAVVAAIGIITVQLVVPRLPTVAAFWRVGLVPAMIWVLCGCIVAFGVRRVARGYVAWLFVIACFPPFFLLAGQLLGGAALAYGALTNLYGAAAMFLALRHSRMKWLITPAFLVIGSAGVYLLRDATPAVAYLGPASVLTALAVVLFVRRPPDAHTTMPARSMVSVLVAGTLAVVAVVAMPHPAPSARSSDLVWVHADWLDRLAAGGIEVSPPREFAWGDDVMGDAGSVVRYRLRSGGLVTYLDVYSTRHFGRFAEYGWGIWYTSAPPATLTARFDSDGGDVTQFAELSNARSPVMKPEDSSWSARSWMWRLHDGSGVTYQTLYLMGSRNPTVPEQITEPRAPTFRTTVIDPFGWLLRDHILAHPATPVDDSQLVSLAHQIVDGAKV